MQIVIDIPESEYFLIKRSDNSALADCVSKEAMMFCIKNGTPTVEAIPIPKDTTNGNIIKSMFPSVVIRVITESQIGISFFDNQNEITWIPIEWWNAPYKEVTG